MRTLNVRAVVTGMCALALVACSGGDDSDATTTTATAPTTVAPTTTPTTAATTVPTTPAPTEPPTTPAPTTTVDDVTAQIQADLTAGREVLIDLQMHPALDGLDEAMASIAVPGSEYSEQEISFINDLVRLGDVVILGDPPVDLFTVEEVAFEGDEPYQAATVTICEASNAGRITPAENSPIGQDVIVVDAELYAYRYPIHVVLGEDGWRRDTVAPTVVDGMFPGSATCG